MVLTLNCLAQNNYKPGQIITNTGDTLNVYINYREWANNPKTVEYKTTLTERTTHNFTPATVKEYRITNLELYKSYKVLLSMDKADVNDLSKGIDTSAVQDVVFLHSIATGPNVTLYSYSDPIKKRYLVQLGNTGTPYELINRFYYNEDETSKIINTRRYRIQLQQLVSQYSTTDEKLASRIKIAEYHENELVKIVNALNGNTVIKTKPTSATRFFVGAGININKLSNISITQYKDAYHNSSIFPSVSAGFDFLQNGNVGRFIVRAEVLLSGSSFNTAVSENPYGNDYYNLKSKQYTASVMPQFMYNVYNTEILRYIWMPV